MNVDTLITLVIALVACIAGYMVSLLIRLPRYLFAAKPDTSKRRRGSSSDSNRREHPSTILPTTSKLIGANNCCKILLFPDDKLPCKSLYSRFTGRVWYCNNNKCNRYHLDSDTSALIEMMKAMGEAHKLDICMMNLALFELADFLFLLKRNRNAKIRIISDDGKDFRKGTKLPFLIDRGIHVRLPTVSDDSAVDQNRPIMHNKFAIIDDTAVILGSLNWTHSGVLRNRESVLISHSDEVIATLQKEFNNMWSQYSEARTEDFQNVTG